MNKYILIVTLCGLIFTVNSQSASVEKSTCGIQTGLLGFWAYNEAKLSNTIALRTEIGFDFGIWESTFYDDSPFILTPVISLEPRFYYNLKKRLKKSKIIEGNSANFFALKTSYHPDWFVVFNTENVPIVNDISIIPTWGIRRNIGQHFNYETGIGVGYSYTFTKHANFSIDKSEIEMNMHLRIGYRF